MRRVARLAANATNAPTMISKIHRGAKPMDPTLVDASPPPLAMSSAIMIVEEAAADEEERGEERPVTARTPKPAAPPPMIIQSKSPKLLEALCYSL